MQDTITKSYSLLSNLIAAQCAPVGIAWQKILNDTNFVLHVSDNSHPTPLGSYVAACVIYSSIWKQRSIGLDFTSGLPLSTVSYIQLKADSTVFHNTQNWNININTPQAQFSYLDTGLIVQFTNQTSAERDLTFHWDFGDSATSTEANPRHTYSRSGDYIVTLVARSCQGIDTLKSAINVQQLTNLGQNQSRFDVLLYPNPANTNVHIINQTGLPLSGKIYNELGQSVGLVQKFDIEADIRLEHLAKGIYVLVLESDSKVFTQKLIKE
jgi:PKD repeat protein